MWEQNVGILIENQWPCLKNWFRMKRGLPVDFEDAVGWMSDALDMLNPMKQQRLDENENEDDNLLLPDILSDTSQAKVTFFGLRLKGL